MASIEITASERRRQTRSNIYHCLYDTRGFCSRQTLAQSLGLSLPTIYQNLDELIADGLVRYSGESQSTGGRKASGLEIVPDARVAVGVAITEDRLRFSAADLRLNEIAYHKVPHTARFDMDELGGMVARELERFLDECHIQRGRLLGVCIALPGVTDPEGTRLLYAPTIHLRDVELSGLTRRIPYPTYVENDANCSGYAEWFMRGDRENMAYLSLENGVGGAIITGGAVYGGEMAVVMCKLLGLTPGGSHPFVDVPDWANGYVAACYANGITGGTSATTYGTDEPVTAVQAALMVMKPLGYFGYQGEFGDSWELATVKQANEIDLYAGLSVYTNQALTRNDVAQMVLNALECDVMIVREEGGMAVDGNGISVSVKPTYDKQKAENNSGKHYVVGATDDKVMQLCEKLYGNDLKKNGDATDDFGRPANEWTYGSTTITTPKAADLVYTDAVKGSKIYEDLGKVSGINMTIVDTNTDGKADAAGLYVDGRLLQTSSANIPGGLSATTFAIASGNDDKVGAKGTLTEVYYDKDTKAVTIVCINTYLAQASGDYNDIDEELDIVVHATGTFTSTLKQEDFAVSGYEDEDFILVTATTKDGSSYTIDSIAPADVISAVKAGAYKAREYITVGGTKYEYNGVAAKDNSGALGEDSIIDGTNVSLQNTTYNVVLDSYGYAIGVETYSAEADLSDYLFVTNAALNGFDYQAKVVFLDDGSKDTITVAKTKSDTGSAMTKVDAVETGKSPDARGLSADGKLEAGLFYTYTVNKDDEYELTEVAAAQNLYESSSKIEGGKAAAVAADTASVATASTKFIVDGKTYVGIKNAPDVNAGKVWYLTNANGYILAVYSENAGVTSTDASELVYVYNWNTPAHAKDEDDNTYYIYDAIKNGEKTTINVDGNSTITANGLYEIKGYADGYVDDSLLHKVVDGDAQFDVKTADANGITYKDGVLTVTVSASDNNYVLADDVVIYAVDSTDSHSVKTITANTIKNLTIAGGDDVVYLAQESSTDTDIVAVYIVIK